MSLPFDNELQRELARVRRQREGGQHTDLAARMDTPTLSPAGVGSPTAPPPLQDLSSMTDMVTELTRPVDRAQLDQEIEDFNLTYPVNVNDALNAFTLPPVAGTGTGTAPATTTAPPPPSITTTATQTRPTTSTRTRPTTTTTTRHLHPNTPRHHRHDHHRPLTPLHRSPQRWGRNQDHHLHGDDPHWTPHHRRQTTATTSPRALPSVPRFVPSVRGRGRG